MKSITGNWVFSNGSPVANGVVYFQLNQNAAATGSPAQVSPRTTPFTLDINGSLSATILGNDELVPAGTFYRMTVNAPGGGRIYGPQPITLTGTSPININNFTPSYPIL